MVLDPIPQSLPVHFFGSRPQPPTSRQIYSIALLTASCHAHVFDDTHGRCHWCCVCHKFVHTYKHTHFWNMRVHVHVCHCLYLYLYLRPCLWLCFCVRLENIGMCKYRFSKAVLQKRISLWSAQQSESLPSPCFTPLCIFRSPFLAHPLPSPSLPPSAPSHSV